MGSLNLRPAVRARATVGLNRSKYFFDRFGSPYGAFSLRLLNPRYTGNCITLENSGGTRQTIGFDGDSVDEAAITSFASGGNTRVYRWHNQTGDGSQLERGGFDNQPHMTDNSGNIYTDSQGRTSIRFFGGSGARDILSWDPVPAISHSSWAIYILADLLSVHPDTGGPPRFYIGGDGGHPENNTTSRIAYFNTNNGGTEIKTQYNSSDYAVISMSLPEDNRVFSHRYSEATDLLQNAMDSSTAQSTVSISPITINRTRIGAAFGDKDSISCFCSDLIQFSKYVDNPQHLEIARFLKNS